MNITGLNFLRNEVRKLATAAIRISKSIIKTFLRIQYNAAVFPFIFSYGGIKYVCEWFHKADSENTPALEPKSDVIVSAVKKLRNSVISGMSAIGSSRCYNEEHANLNNASTVREERSKIEGKKEFALPMTTEKEISTTENFDYTSTIASLSVNNFSGSHLLWDIPVISAKAQHFAQRVKEGNEDEIELARKELQEHPHDSEIPQTRREYEDMKNKAKNKSKVSEPSVIKLSCAETKSSDNCNGSDYTDSDSFEEKDRRKKELGSYVVSNRHSPRRKSKCLYNPLLTQDKLMCREISTVNKTLRKIQVTCSRLLGELSNLNDALTKVISMKEKLTSLEFQVDEGKRLLQEVECDRFIMKSKLSALEKLINEEEKFLSGDVFCESGFYESIEATNEF